LALHRPVHKRKDVQIALAHPERRPRGETRERRVIKGDRRWVVIQDIKIEPLGSGDGRFKMAESNVDLRGCLAEVLS
jgi:hypothetical protein